jgi:Fe-S oxidoreductase
MVKKVKGLPKKKIHNPSKFSSYAEIYKDVARQAVELCTYCEACIDKCGRQPYYKPPKGIMEKMINFLKGGELTDEVLSEIWNCRYCSWCSNICPVGLDPMLIHEASKVEAIKRGAKPPESFNFVFPGQRYNVYEILSALQIKPSEVRWLKKVPPKPKKVENVYYVGCFPVAIPSVVFSFLDVLERMGVEFVAVAGGELCCGTVYMPGAGMVEESEKKARELVNALNAYSPERVIVTCTGCYRQFTEFMPKYLDLDFEVQFYAQFLKENMDKLKFVKPIEKKVFLQESCMPRRTKVDEYVKKVVEAIPGLEIVSSKALCCGGLSNMASPQIAQNYGRVIVEEAVKSGADYLISSCPFCRLNSYPHIRKHALSLKDIAELINESTGGKEYEDSLEKFWRCKNVAEIIEKSKENFQANGFTEEEMRKILPFIFAFTPS